MYENMIDGERTIRSAILDGIASVHHLVRIVPQGYASEKLLIDAIYAALIDSDLEWAINQIKQASQATGD